ncbi:hypothetical protein, partial [Streptomyces sp. NPDC006551]|uniref:hypothetical protein n=1 Tax=Streptomyces sp. NPDC006551 TaxID=3157178 RepID=UPI0033AFB857
LLTDVETHGLLGAAVLGMDRQATSLGALIKLMGSAARAKSPATTPDELRALRMRLEQSGRLGSLVPGFDGQPTPIGDLIKFALTKKTITPPSPSQGEDAKRSAA